MLPRELQRLSRVADWLIDDRVGVIERLYFVPLEAGAPNFFHCAALACRTEALGFLPNFRVAGGASSNRYRAAAKALGEAVERYCSAIFNIDELPFAAYSDAPFPCVAPEEFALFLPWQYQQENFPYVPFTRDTTIRWAPAREIGGNCVRYVPAATVFMPYYFIEGSGDFPVLQPISTGLACHGSFEEAALGAVCEAIERDAFTLTWQTKTAPPQIRAETLSDHNYDLLRRFEAIGDSITVFNITTDVNVPTILSVARNDAPDAPALVVAAASSMSAEDAVMKSLEELAHTRRYSQQLKSRMAPISRKGFSDVVTQVDHIEFWCRQENRGLADFLFQSRERLDFETIASVTTGDPSADLVAIDDLLRRRDLVAYLVELTSSDVRDLGLSVVRAVVPGLHPLCMGFRLRSLGGTRFSARVPAYAAMGLKEDCFVHDVPHPYP